MYFIGGWLVNINHWKSFVISIKSVIDQMYTWNKDGQDNEQAWQNQNTNGFGGLNTRQKQAES